MESSTLQSFAPDRAEFYLGRLGDPHAAFRRLRAEDPVHWYEPGGFWCVTRHADLQHVSRTPAVFSSAQGTQLFEIPLRREGQGGAVPGAGPTRAILQMDPPEHRRYRRLVVGAFTPRRVAKLEPRMRALAREIVAALEPGERVDFVEAVAAPLPLLVIAELLGVPMTDRADFRRWSDAMIEAGGGEAVSPAVQATVGELFAYFAEKLAERRRQPRDDLISQLLQAEIEGQRLAEPDILMFCLTLLVAGNETTRNLISGGALALLEHPGQRDRLLEDPARIRNAVEEMLRWWTPVQTFVRRVLRPAELRNRKLEAGDFVVLLYGSANRDEEVFGPDAERFDVERGNAARHVAFGFGEHLCLGAALARLEARIVFEELLARRPRFELAGPVELLPSVLIRGIEGMPVVFAP